MRKHNGENNTVTLIPADEQKKDFSEREFDSEALENFYNQVVGGADASFSFSVKRERNGIKGMEHCFSYSISDYTYDELLEKLQSEYGAGTYRLYVRDEKGKLKLNQPIVIAKPLRGMEKPDNNNDIVDKILTTQQAMFDRLQAALEPKKTQLDWVQIATVLPPILIAIKQFIPQRPDPTNPLEIIKLAKELGGLQPGAESASMMDAVSQAISTFGKPVVESLVSQDAGKVNALLEENQKLKNLLVSKQQHQEMPAFDQADVLTDISAQQKMEETRAIIKFCVKGAKKSAEPVEYANFILDQLDDDQQQEFFVLASSQDDCLKILAMLDENVNTYQDWFKLVLSNYCSYFTESDENQEFNKDN